MKLFSDEDLVGLYGSSIFQAIPEEKYCHVFACLKADKAALKRAVFFTGLEAAKNMPVYYWTALWRNAYMMRKAIR